MQNVTMNGFKRINKKQARALYAAGNPIWFTHHKLIPANNYHWMRFERNDDYFCSDTYKCRFDALVGNWIWANANSEWGYYPAFYVQA